MTPKDKAIELYNKYEQLGRDFTRGVSMKEFAKQCALIAVDEIIKSNPMLPPNLNWLEVKKEIEAL
jgi:predicted proteasome-type protease